MKEQRFLDAHELAGLDQHLEELVLLVAPDARPAQRFLGARGRGFGAAELALERVDHALLLRREAYLVRGEPRLVTLGLDDALAVQRGHQEREDALVGAAGAAAELLARHPWLERVRAVERRQLVHDEFAQAREAVGMNEPVTVDADGPAVGLQRPEQNAEALGSERHAPRQSREPHSTGPDVSDVLFEHDLWAPGLEHLEMGDQGRPLSLEARRIDVEQGAAADRHDRRIRAHDEAVARPRDQRRLEAEARERRVARYQLRPI